MVSESHEVSLKFVLTFSIIIYFFKMGKIIYTISSY